MTSCSPTRRALGLVTLLALTGLSAPLSAQTKKVVPAANATVEGNSFDQRPFGLERVRLTQLIPMDILGIPRGRQITELGYRRDGEILKTTAMVRRVTTAWSVRLGNINTGIASGVQFDPRNPTGLYLRPGNGTNSLIEYYNAIPNWPSLLPKVGATADFVLRFKLRSPFVVQGPNAIAVDHYMYGANGATFAYYIDAVRGNVDRGTVSYYGDSCPTPNVHNRGYAIPSNPGGDDLEFSLFGAVPNGLAILAIGGSKTTWATIPLPLKLDAFGLKGCSILASQDILVATTAQTTGSARIAIPMPNDPKLAGITVYGQWMVVDTQLSQKLPFTFSNGIEVKVGTSLGASGLTTSVLYGVNLGAVVRGRYGLVDRGFSPVTEFVHN